LSAVQYSYYQTIATLTGLDEILQQLGVSKYLSFMLIKPVLHFPKGPNHKAWLFVETILCTLKAAH